MLVSRASAPLEGVLMLLFVGVSLALLAGGAGWARAAGCLARTQARMHTRLLAQNFVSDTPRELYSSGSVGVVGSFVYTHMVDAVGRRIRPTKTAWNTASSWTGKTSRLRAADSSTSSVG